MITLSLVGAPNSGKTSLFNWLTGSKFKTVNYAGSTVEIHRGQSLALYGREFAVVDTPGVYSLIAGSRDEEVTLDLLTREGANQVILVLDATQLKRQLLLAFQMIEMNVPFSIALTMEDLLKKNHRQINIEALREILQVDIVSVDTRLGGGVKDLVAKFCHSEPNTVIPWKLDQQRLNEMRDEKFVKELSVKARSLGERVVKSHLNIRPRQLDRWLINSVLSLPLFILVMSLFFTSVFFLAAPLMDLVDVFFASLSEFVSGIVGEGILGNFLTTGMIEGTGAVLVFVPQIFILFLGLSFLEESGYLARASTLIDRPLHALGLSGRSFVPLLSGFACAVPAIMATRNLKSSRERWITVFIIPFMTCSARLPVYALLLAFLFFGEASWKPGVSLAAIYFVSLFLGAAAAWILNRLLKVKEKTYFMMELPPYRMPQFSRMVSDSLRRTNSYVVKAGPIILFFVLILWLLTHLPFDPSWSEEEQLKNSFLAQIGHYLEPLFLPMGLDWRAGVAMLSAFIAREVFVSAMAVIFNLGQVTEAGLQDSLLQQMKLAQFADGGLIFTAPAVVAMVVFFMFALQCVSTTGVTVKEMGSWRYGLVQLVVLNVLAYVFAVASFQALSAVM